MHAGWPRCVRCVRGHRPGPAAPSLTPDRSRGLRSASPQRPCRRRRWGSAREEAGPRLCKGVQGHGGHQRAADSHRAPRGPLGGPVRTTSPHLGPPRTEHWRRGLTPACTAGRPWSAGWGTSLQSVGCRTTTTGSACPGHAYALGKWAALKQDRAGGGTCRERPAQLALSPRQHGTPGCSALGSAVR